MTTTTIPITSTRAKTGLDWPAPADMLLSIWDEIHAHNDANPGRQFPVEAMSVIRRGIAKANAAHVAEGAQ